MDTGNELLESNQNEVSEGHKLTLDLNKDIHDKYFYGYGQLNTINPRNARHSKFISYICKNSESLLDSVPESYSPETPPTLTTIEVELDAYRTFKELEKTLDSEFPSKSRGEVVSMLFASALSNLETED